MAVRLLSARVVSLICILHHLASHTCVSSQAHHAKDRLRSLSDQLLHATPHSHSQVSSELRNPSIKLSHVLNERTRKELNLKTTDRKFHQLLERLDEARHHQLSRKISSFRRTEDVGPGRLFNGEDLASDFERRGLKATSVTSAFAVQGSIYPAGLYRALIGLGTPEQLFNVNIDTGSSLTWVNCLPCEACTQSDVQQLSPPFDSHKSSTFQSVACDSDICRSTFNNSCGTNSDGCSYGVGYADGSSTAGTLIEDMFWVSTGTTARPVPTPLVFGCGNAQTGTFFNGAGWTRYDAVDGLMGLGRGQLSLTTYLAKNSSALGIRNVFTICLGTGFTGGLLAFGDANIPKHVVYTPIMKDSPYFQVNLVNVFVGGHPLSVPRAALYNPTEGNAIFDSGTTYTAVHPKLQNAIMNMIKLKVGLTPAVDNPQDGNLVGALCYDETDSWPLSAISSRFPNINLQFDGQGKFMNIPPPAYTFTVEDETPRQVCSRIIPNNNSAIQHFSLIGDIWMRNFVFVHDLENLRIGWAPMQC